MRFDVITIFPEIIEAYTNESILKRAQAKKLIKVNIHNLRDFAADKHKKTDDRPFGGGPGMVFKVEPIVKAVSSIRYQVSKKKPKIIIFTPGGKRFDDKIAQKLAKEEQLIMICGRYEGIDARVKKIIQNSKFKIQELSIGPYVLTGGEIPAMVLIDAVSRKISGVLGKTDSLEEKRQGIGVLVYTRPETFKYKGKSYKVPPVLLGGDHKKIEKWRNLKGGK